MAPAPEHPFLANLNDEAYLNYAPTPHFPASRKSETCRSMYATFPGPYQYLGPTHNHRALYNVHGSLLWLPRPLIVLRVARSFVAMALQYDGKPSGTAAPGARKYTGFDDEKDWNLKMDDSEVNTREIDDRFPPSGNDARQLDPVTDLRQRLSMWGMLDHALVQKTDNADGKRSKLPRGQERFEDTGQLFY